MRSTVAAPTFFEPGKVDATTSWGQDITMYNIDGGVIANDPSMLVLSEMFASEFSADSGSTWKPIGAHNMVVLSMGCGKSGTLRPKFRECGKSMAPANAKNWGPMQWVTQLFAGLFEGGTI